MKRYVAPHGLIPLEELYAQYGKKYNLPKDESFMLWLQEVKLKDKERWVFVGDQEDFSSLAEEMRQEKKTEEEAGLLDKRPAELQVSELADLSVRKAREALPMISDARILKYALKEASQRPHSDSLCNLLRKRITELASQGIA